MANLNKNNFFVFAALAFFAVCIAWGVSHYGRGGASPSGDAMPVPKNAPPAFVAGKALYEKQCAGCHGLGGRGDGAAAYLLSPKPRDFGRGEFRLISRRDGRPADKDLFKTITRGMPGSGMPGWDFLSEQDRWNLVRYVRYLFQLQKEKDDGKVTDAMLQHGLAPETINRLMTEDIPEGDVPVVLTAEPPSDKASVARGRELFLKGCASCHGPEGKGDGKQPMKDSAGLPIQARDLTGGLFKGAPTSEELYYRMVAGLPGSPMPSYQAAFNDAQIWDLIHYVQTLPKPGVEERSGLRHRKITIKKVDGELPAGAGAPVWKSIAPAFIPLTPLWWRDDRIEGVEVKAVQNGEQLAVLLMWPDATKDDVTVAPQAFSDGAALQWSTQEGAPFFAMGSAQAAVHLWHWKAAWQKDIGERSDIETQYPNAAVDWYSAQKNYEHGAPFEVRDSKTSFHDPAFMGGWGAGNPLSDPQRTCPAEEAMSKGLGTLTTQKPQGEAVDARGEWKDGQWQVIFRRALTSREKGALQFAAGQPVHVAFAVWDGAKNDRNGQKMISVWNDLKWE